jgi:hypothetical protein
MKILFLCGSAEPGKDGVGDYTRRLCGALIRKGHQAQILALCDRQVNTFVSEVQVVDDTQVLVYRIPMANTKEQRLVFTQRIINTLQPKCISLQYVPYSYNAKGLPFWLPVFLKRLEGNHQWHIMFHELWLGVKDPSSLKDRIIGNWQKNIIKRFLKFILPLTIHTQSPFYKMLLETKGIKVKLLPLFSNIPKKNGVDFNNRDTAINMLVFGTIHYSSRVEDFLETLAKYKATLNKEISIKFIGRNGNEISTWKKFCNRLGLGFEVLGEQSAITISEILKTTTIGITTTALPMIQKSGTVAAMRENGLPVICVSDIWKTRSVHYDFVPEGIFTDYKQCINACINFERNSICFPGLGAITKTFLSDLKI